MKEIAMRVGKFIFGGVATAIGVSNIIIGTVAVLQAFGNTEEE